MYFVHEGFALKFDFSLAELEQALVNVEALHKRPNGADSHALASVSQAVEPGAAKMEPPIGTTAGMTAEVVINNGSLISSGQSFLPNSLRRRTISYNNNNHHSTSLAAAAGATATSRLQQ